MNHQRPLRITSPSQKILRLLRASVVLRVYYRKFSQTRTNEATDRAIAAIKAITNFQLRMRPGECEGIFFLRDIAIYAICNMLGGRRRAYLLVCSVFVHVGL